MHESLAPLTPILGEGNGTPLQYSCLENPMDGGVWWAAVHGVAKSWTRLSDFTFTFHFHALEKEMATHSSVLAWRIPGTGEPAGMPSLGSHRVGHDRRDSAAAAAATPILFKGPLYFNTAKVLLNIFIVIQYIQVSSVFPLDIPPQLLHDFQVGDLVFQKR